MVVDIYFSLILISFMLSLLEINETTYILAKTNTSLTFVYSFIDDSIWIEHTFINEML